MKAFAWSKSRLFFVPHWQCINKVEWKRRDNAGERIGTAKARFPLRNGKPRTHQMAFAAASPPLYDSLPHRWHKPRSTIIALANFFTNRP